MSVATECVPEIELPVGFVPSPSVRPAAPRRFSVIPGAAAPARPDAVPAGRRPEALVRPVGPRPARVDGPSALVEAAPIRVLPSVPVARPVRRAGAPLAAPGRSTAPLRQADPAPLRLTRRGRLAVTVGALALAVTFVWLAWLGAASHPAASAPSSVPATVVVHPGDTLWSLARHYAPQRDPRAVVDTLMRLNHLSSGTVTPGQVLRLH